MAREHKYTPVITHTIEEAVIFTFIASLSRKTTWGKQISSNAHLRKHAKRPPFAYDVGP